MAATIPMKKERLCAGISPADLGREVVLFGWVNNKRELGGITFIDLRDFSGLAQLVVGADFPGRELIKSLSREDVVAVCGTVKKREKANPELASGAVEVVLGSLELLSRAETPPFLPENSPKVAEELGLKYRYLELRNSRFQYNLRTRSRVAILVRNFLAGRGFVEIETPMLTKSTPEGARDYLVPSRIHAGRFYALPQSPQLFKQILMISGFERYFQVVRCFRDEDLRADRQPEFTQIDIEMSFAEPQELFAIIEEMMREAFALIGINVATPFQRIDFQEAYQSYGSDKPDLRIPYRIVDLGLKVPLLKSELLSGLLAQGLAVKGLAVDDDGQFSRSEIDRLDKYCRELGAKGLIWMRSAPEGFKSSLKLAENEMAAFWKSLELDGSKVLFLMAGPEERTLFIMGKLRELLGKKYQEKGRFEFCWVVDFPLFFYNEEEKRYESNHHPFTSPSAESIARLDTEPLAARAVAYDLVLNGFELGGGSKRISDPELQQKVFRLLNISGEEIQSRFGFFLEALRYGTPPHLGIALGLDRLLMLMLQEESLRDVIAFPKSTSAMCLMSGAPSGVDKRQLRELKISSGDQG